MCCVVCVCVSVGSPYFLPISALPDLIVFSPSNCPSAIASLGEARVEEI